MCAGRFGPAPPHCNQTRACKLDTKRCTERTSLMLTPQSNHTCDINQAFIQTRTQHEPSKLEGRAQTHLLYDPKGDTLRSERLGFHASLQPNKHTHPTPYTIPFAQVRCRPQNKSQVKRNHAFCRRVDTCCNQADARFMQTDAGRKTDRISPMGAPSNIPYMTQR